MKIKWRIYTTSTFRRSKAWPIGFSDAAQTYALAKIVSDSDEAYIPRRARSGEHGPLRVSIAVYKDDGISWSWMRSPKLFDTVGDAKSFAVAAYQRNPRWLPPALRAH